MSSFGTLLGRRSFDFRNQPEMDPIANQRLRRSPLGRLWPAPVLALGKQQQMSEFLPPAAQFPVLALVQ
jgi:hypothetical protein